MLIFSSKLYTIVNSTKTLTFILNGFSGGTIQIAPSSIGRCQEDAIQNDEQQQRRIHGFVLHLNKIKTIKLF